MHLDERVRVLPGSEHVLLPPMVLALLVTEVGVCYQHHEDYWEKIECQGEKQCRDFRPSLQLTEAYCERYQQHYPRRLINRKRREPSLSVFPEVIFVVSVEGTVLVHGMKTLVALEKRFYRLAPSIYVSFLLPCPGLSSMRSKSGLDVARGVPCIAGVLLRRREEDSRRCARGQVGRSTGGTKGTKGDKS